MATFYHFTQISSSPTTSGIYRLTCIVNQKIYIGSANDFKVRWRQHVNALRGNYHHCRHLQNAFTKYGEETFYFEIIELILPPFLFEREQYWLDKLEPDFNIARSVRAPLLGRKHSPETCEKLKSSHIGNTSALGHTCSPEAREKMRQAKIGKKHSEEHIRKNAEARKGRKHSPETLEKLRTASLGRTVKPETREKLRIANLGKKHSQERIDKVREAGKDRWTTLIVTDPNGKEYIVHGVQQFCREHGLDSTNLRRVAKGGQTNHKGWKARFPDADID